MCYYQTRAKSKAKTKVRQQQQGCGYDTWFRFPSSPRLLLKQFQMNWTALVTIGIILVNSWIPHQVMPQTIKIGGLFDKSDPYEEAAFHHAAMRVNHDRTIIGPYQLAPQLEKFTEADSHHASKQVCKLLKEGIVGLIGPQTPQSSSYVQSLCEVFGIPRIETKWDFHAGAGNFLINLYPHPANLSEAYADVIRAWGWERFIVIYENEQSLVRLQDILQLSTEFVTQIIVKQLPPESNDYRPLLKELRIQHSDILFLVIDCDAAKLPTIFSNAKEVGMVNDYRYFLTTLDMHTLPMEDISFGDTNITALRLVDPDSQAIQNIAASWADIRHVGFPTPVTPYRRPTNYYDEVYFPRNYHPTPAYSKMDIPELRNGTLRTETALIYDAVELFAQALHALGTSQTQRFEIEPLNCQEPKMWEHGFSILRILKKLQIHGLSGIIELEDGQRRRFKLDIMEITKSNLTKVGTYDTGNPKSKRFHWIRTYEDTQRQQAEELRNAHLIVSTKLSDPYFQRWPNGTEKGFSVELIRMLSVELGFNYTFQEVKDGKGYGGKDDNARFGWNGCVGEILRGEADLAIGDMSITHDRQKVIDFTMPFMNLGIAILALKPHKDPPGLFSFMQPFHSDVWIYMATAYLGVSLLLFILARMSPSEWQNPPANSPDSGTQLENPLANLLIPLWFSIGSLLQAGCEVLPKLTPYEWLNPHPCDFSPKELELSLHLPNSLWFTIGSLMQQGSDIAPKMTPYEWLNPNPTVESPDVLELTLHVLNSMWFTIGAIMQQGADTQPKLTPYQWLNPHPCKDDPEELVNDLTVANAMWHNWGSIMQQGSDIAPKAGSTRLVAGIWWFFTLIIISSYTANLAAFLTSEGMEQGIGSVADLPKQTKVKYGSQESGSTLDFFKYSKFPLYAEIYKNMEAMKPSPYVTSGQQGVDRVLESKGTYVFFMESVSIAYQTERICNLTQLGEPLDEKGYGIGMRKGSKYLDAFSAEIIKLSGKGKLQELQDFWWKQTGKEKCPKEVVATGGATALTMHHVGGVFVVLVGGCALASIMAFVEFFWKARKLGVSEGENKWTEIKKELKFALQCQGDSKPVKKPLSLNPTERSETGSVPYLFLNDRKEEPHDAKSTHSHS